VQVIGATTLMMPAWRTDFATYSLAVTNVPTNTSFVATGVGLVRDGIDFSVSETFGSMVGTSTVIAVDQPADFGDRLRAQIAIGYDQTSPGSFGLLLKRPPIAPMIPVDLATEMLPRVFGSTVDATDPVRPSIAWMVAAPSAADMIVVTLPWQGGLWTLMYPPTTTSPVKVPALPVEIATLEPPFSAAGVIYLDLSITADYEEFKDAFGLTIFEGGAPGGDFARYSAVNFQ
jgi:hypothetical protein